jgi:response regulator RpfG family c-di-GMP phosphodiesterase
MAEQASSYQSILIVDDDLSILKLLKKIFSQRYEVKTAMSGQEGLKALSMGLEAGVILSDLYMPGMKGSEFLSRSAEYQPMATRILLTGHLDTKEIITAVSEAKAFMYLTKPFYDLQLVQSVKMGFDYHKSMHINRKLLENQKSQNDKIQILSKQLKQVSDDNKYMMEDTLLLVNSILANSTKHIFFVDSNNYLSNLASAIAEEARMKSDVVVNVRNAATLINLALIRIPESLRIQNIFDMTNSKDVLVFLSYFKEGLKILNTNPNFRNYAQILTQLFEHADGTGLPNNISLHETSLESSFLSIAYTYFSSVYMLNSSQYDSLMTEGKVIQSKEETLQRHQRAVQFIINKARWFDESAFLAFQRLVDYENLKEIVPIDNTLFINKNLE